MANINIENLMNFDRILTWLQLPSCARCSLPFSNNGPVQRVPLVLSCHHMMCGRCVREFCDRDIICCGQCHHETLVRDCDNPASFLNPSYYVLGSIQQAQYELANLDPYRDARRDFGAGAERQESTTAETVTPGATLLVSQLGSAKQVQALLEDAYHSYERSKNQLEKFDREQQINVGSVIGQVNDYFVQLHNILQQEQNRQLQKIRNKYAEMRRHQEDDQMQLQEVHGQLTKFLQMIKWFNDKDKKQKTSLSWLNFVQDVKTYLENEPLTLRGNFLRQQQPFRFRGDDATLASVSPLCHGRLVSEALTVKELAKLVPFTTPKSKSKTKQKRDTDSTSEGKETVKEAKGDVPKTSRHADSVSSKSSKKKLSRTDSDRSESSKQSETLIGIKSSFQGNVTKTSRHADSVSSKSSKKKLSRTDSDRSESSKQSETLIGIKSSFQGNVPKTSRHVDSGSSTSSKQKLSRTDSDRSESSKQSETFKSPFQIAGPSSAIAPNATETTLHSLSDSSTDLNSTVRPKRDGTSNDTPPTPKTFLDHHGTRVLVTHIVSPQQLYVQDEMFAKTAPTLAELCNSDAQKYHAELDGQFTIAEGSLYLVRPVVESSFSWPAKWYRARVTRKYPPQQYLVQYIDFGHLERVSEDQIRPISPELKGFLVGAQKVSLHDVTPKVRASGTNDEWAAECRQLMVDFIANRQVVMVELTKEGNGTRTVDLLHPPEGFRIPVQSLREALHYFDLCQTVPGDRKQPQAVQRLNRWLQMHRSKHWSAITSPRKLAQHDSFPCTIRHSTAPDNFQLMPTKWGVDILEPIQQELDQCASERAKVYAPYVGLVCAFTDQREPQGGGTGHWMRGRVTHVGVRQCTLLAIDSGKLYANIAWDNIRLMGAESLWVAPVVVNCQLAYIRPKTTNNGTDDAGPSCQWSREAVQEFNQILASRTMLFEVTIETKPEENGSYGVLLYLLNRKTRDTCVNGLLVQNGYAECASQASALIADRVKEVIAEPESPRVKKMAARKAGGLKPSQTLSLSDPRVPVKILRVQSPAEFYVQRKSCKAGMEQLHNEIQEYMDDRIEEEEPDAEQEQRAIGDVCVAFARAPGSASCEWYRAQVTATLEGDTSQYEMFLIDQAVTVQVHRANMARLPVRFAQIQPAAIRCKLANVKPVGGSDRWHQSSIDSFKSVACSFSSHAVLLERHHETTRELPVVLWGVRVEETGALTPRRTVYTNLNQSLVDSGYAHRIAPFEPLGGSDRASPPTADDVVQTFEKAVTSQFETEYRQLQQFFRAIDDATAETASSAKLVNSTAAGRRDDEAWEETVRSLIDRQVMEIADWPDALPIEKSIFVGTPTHVGTDGTIYLQDESYQSVVAQLKNEIQQHVTTATEMGDGRIKSRLLAVGDVCLARFYLDQNYYRARVTAVGRNRTYSVQFVDYGNIEQCTIDDLRCDTICCRMPVLVNCFRLQELEPRESVATGGQWPDVAVDALHSLIVMKRCTVRVTGKRSRGDPEPRCTLQIIDGNVDVAEVLCGLQLFVQGDDKRQRQKKRDSQAMVQFTNAPSAAPCRSIMDIMNEIVCDDDGIEGTDDPYAHGDGYEDNASDRASHSDSDSSVCDPIDLLSAVRDLGEPPMVDTPLPSPASFNSHEFETSSLRSSVERMLGESHHRNLGGCGSFGGFPILQFDQYQRGFYAMYTNYTDPLTLHVYPQIEGHTIRMGQMAQAIQTYAMSNNKFHKWQASLLEPQAPCLALFAEDGQFYRAVVEGCDHETREARVLFVDYLNRATVPIDTGIRKCPTAIQSVPLHNVTVRLAGVRPNPRSREDDVACQLAMRLQKSFYVRLLHQTYQRAEGGAPIPLVELYTSEDFRTLVYQPLIDEKFFLTDPLGTTK